MTARRRASQASVGLVVVGLHLVAVLAWWTTEHGMRMVRSNDTRLPSIAVWLPALPTLDNTKQAQPTSRQQRTQDAVASPSQRDEDNSKSAEKNRTVDPTIAPAANSGIYMPTEPRGSADAQAPAQNGPDLNLNLSRKSIASAAPPSFAEQSPFRGRLPATVERQIATAAAETGPWTEERIDNDRIRFRRGNTCVTMERPRIATLDPFNEALARTPWRTNGPETCQ